MSEVVRDTLEISKTGRCSFCPAIRKITDIQGKKAFCQVENYGKDKILITILQRWTPTDTPGRDVVKK